MFVNSKESSFLVLSCETIIVEEDVGDSSILSIYIFVFNLHIYFVGIRLIKRTLLMGLWKYNIKCNFL